MKTLTKRVERAQAHFDAEVERIAEGVRTKYVLPACAKYGLEFAAGNGTFAFFGEHDGEKICVGSCIGELPEAARRYGWGLARAFKALCVKVDRQSFIGDWVRDVRKSDYEKGWR